MIIKDYRNLKLASKREGDQEVKDGLEVMIKALRMKIIGTVINSLALVLIFVGFIFNSSMPYLLILFHGALTGIFLLGIILDIINAINRRRNKGSSN